MALRGEVAADGGARNGEIVRLSAEPGDWTHFRGGPVSCDGQLVGVVHTVLPDRMVFLAATTLLEEEGFRAALGSGRLPTGNRDPGFRVALTVRAGDGIHPHGPSARRQLTGLLTRMMTRAAVTGRFGRQDKEQTVSVLLEAPGALAQAGRLLAELPGVVAPGGESWPEGAVPHLTVALDIGGAYRPVKDVDGLLGHEAVLTHLRGHPPITSSSPFPRTCTNTSPSCSARERCATWNRSRAVPSGGCTTEPPRSWRNW